MNDPHSLGSASNKASTRRPFERHYADTAPLSASAEDIFGFVDDFTKLSSHMSRSSAMTMGGCMRTSFDAAHGHPQECAARRLNCVPVAAHRPSNPIQQMLRPIVTQDGLAQHSDGA